MYRIKKIIPSRWFKTCFFLTVNMVINKSNGARMATKISTLLAMLNCNGLIIELITSISKILKIFEPTIFPIAISVFFFKAVIDDVANSGRDVPKAIIVTAINDWLTPRKYAISTAPSTTHLAPMFNILRIEVF